MSLLRSHTGFELFPLTAGSNDAPTGAPGTPITFEMRNLPILLGRKPYYMYGVILNFEATIDQDAEAGAGVAWDQLCEALIDSVEVRNAWHGTPVSQQHVKGQLLKVIEFVGAGYRYVQRPQPAIPASTDGTFRRLIYIPLSVGCGDKPHHTAQLNLFYKQAQLIINLAAASVLAGLDTGAVFSEITVKATACILPEPEIRLGCGVEWIDYRSASSASQEQILLAAFGNTTGLTGTIPDAGVLWLGALTNNEMPGSFNLPDVVRYTNPWRGQVPITDIDSMVAMQNLAMGDAMPCFDQGGGSTISPAGFPFAMTRNYAPLASDALAGVLALPLVTEARDVELTKVQTAKGDQSFYLSGPAFSGTNHTLAQHIRSWDDNKREDAVRQIVDSGIAKACLGRSDWLGWAPKLLNKNDTIDGEKMRYLPWRLVREEPKKVAPLGSLFRR